MVTTVTVMIMCVVQEGVTATMASEEKPAKCVRSVTTAPTAQSVAVVRRESVMRALKVLDSACVSRAGRAIAARVNKTRSQRSAGSATLRPTVCQVLVVSVNLGFRGTAPSALQNLQISALSITAAVTREQTVTRRDCSSTAPVRAITKETATPASPSTDVLKRKMAAAVTLPPASSPVRMSVSVNVCRDTWVMESSVWRRWCLLLTAAWKTMETVTLWPPARTCITMPTQLECSTCALQRESTR